MRSRGESSLRLAATWGESDPVAGGTLAVTSLRPGPLQDQAVLAVVERWAQSGAPAIKAQISQFPKGPLRQTAMGELASAPTGSAVRTIASAGRSSDTITSVFTW